VEGIEDRELLINGCRFSTYYDEKILEIDRGDGYTTL